MIGVAKNHSVSRFARMSRMSRKWTVNAESTRASAMVNSSCTKTMIGNQSSSPAVSGARYQIKNAARIGSPSRKWIMFASTVTIGRISAGKSTFLIRLLPAIRTPADSVNDDENHVHGRIPQNMNSAYGSAPSAFAGMTYLKMNEYTSRSSNGLKNDQKKPSTDPR